MFMLPTCPFLIFFFCTYRPPGAAKALLQRALAVPILAAGPASGLNLYQEKIEKNFAAIGAIITKLESVRAQTGRYAEDERAVERFGGENFPPDVYNRDSRRLSWFLAG